MATIKDISKETGLSIGTVSRVFNNRGYISQETKTRREYPLSLVAFSMAESRSEKNGWAMWGTISPMILEEDLERDLATALG